MENPKYDEILQKLGNKANVLNKFQQLNDLRTPLVTRISKLQGEYNSISSKISELEQLILDKKDLEKSALSKKSEIDASMLEFNSLNDEIKKKQADIDQIAYLENLMVGKAHPAIIGEKEKPK